MKSDEDALFYYKEIKRHSKLGKLFSLYLEIDKFEREAGELRKEMNKMFERMDEDEKKEVAIFIARVMQQGVSAVPLPGSLKAFSKRNK